jgi:predicted lipoprotein
MTQGTGYAAGLELDFDGDDNEIMLQIGIIEGGSIIETPVLISFDTFYKLAVHVDANQNMHAYLYKMDNTLLGSLSRANVLSIESGKVGILLIPAEFAIESA